MTDVQIPVALQYKYKYKHKYKNKYILKYNIISYNIRPREDYQMSRGRGECILYIVYIVYYTLYSVKDKVKTMYNNFRNYTTAQLLPRIRNTYKQNCHSNAICIT